MDLQKSGPGIPGANENLLIGKNELKLADVRYVDSMQMNEDHFMIMEGDVKFTVWKENSIILIRTLI